MNTALFSRCQSLVSHICILTLIIICTFSVAHAQQCADGVDNDGDGKVDAYYESATIRAGRWVAGWAKSCSSICRGAGLTPGSNYEGDACVSGEVLTPHATNQLGFGIFRAGCWSESCQQKAAHGDHRGRGLFSSSIYCWHPGQKRDYDATDIIAACYCVENKLVGVCGDGIDNDGDGKVDLADGGCENVNDADERIHDPECSSRSDDNEGPDVYECNDSIDNDNDGFIDLNDFSCSSATDNDESFPKSACQDGVDNDGDGKVDLNDIGCRDSQDDSELNLPQCSDNIDNDGDGKIDALLLSNTIPASVSITNNKEIRSVANADGAGIQEREGNGVGVVRSDSSSRQRICELLGYRTVTYFKTGDYHSPGDNTLGYWNASGKYWVVGNAKKLGNKKLDAITCANPITACNDGVDNDHDGKN